MSARDSGAANAARLASRSNARPRWNDGTSASTARFAAASSQRGWLAIREASRSMKASMLSFEGPIYPSVALGEVSIDVVVSEDDL